MNYEYKMRRLLRPGEEFLLPPTVSETDHQWARFERRLSCAQFEVTIDNVQVEWCYDDLPETVVVRRAS